MPLFRQDREDPQAPELAETATIRPQSLTEELLDGALAAVEAVLATPQVQEHDSARRALTEGFKALDKFYPHTLKAYGEQEDPVSTA